MFQSFSVVTTESYEPERAKLSVVASSVKVYVESSKVSTLRDE